MGLKILANNDYFVFFKWELVVAGSIVVNFITQLLKKTFKNWYGSVIAILSSFCVSTGYLLYYLIYRLDYNMIKNDVVMFTAKMIYEYFVFTILLIICCKVGYDTLKCYIQKIEEILLQTNQSKGNKDGGNN